MQSTTFEPGDYDTATLPLTKKEKRRHHSHRDMRPLGTTRNHLNPVQPPPNIRRSSISTPYAPPEQLQPPPPAQSGPAHHSGRKLPVTPSEDPFSYTHYQRQHHEPPRPHSRAESAPDPLPIPPWKSKFVQRSQLVHLPHAGTNPVHLTHSGTNPVHLPHAGTNPVHSPTASQVHSQSPYSDQMISPHASQVNPSHANQMHPPHVHGSQMQSPYASQVHPPYPIQRQSPNASQVHSYHNQSPHASQPHSPYSSQPHSPYSSQPHSPYSSQPPSPYTSQVYSPSGSPPPGSRTRSPVARNPDREERNPGYKEPLVSPLSHFGTKPSKKKAGGLKPMRPRSVSHSSGVRLSGSMDTNLHTMTTQPTAKNFGSLKNRSQVAPGGHKKTSMNGAATLGWASSSHFTTSPQRKHPPADVQALMRMKLPLSPYNSIQDIPKQVHSAEADGGSLTSMDLKHEYFTRLSPQASTIVRSVENLKVDPITGAEISAHKSHQHGHRDRSVSARPVPRQHSVYEGMPELSTSYNRMDDRQLVNGQVYVSYKGQEMERPRGRRAQEVSQWGE